MRTDVAVPVYEHIRRCGDEQWGYVDSDVVCQSPYSPLRYFATVTCANMVGSSTRLVFYPSKAECNHQCSQYATAWAPGYSATAIDCSCETLPLCTCESATSSASSRRVTDSASCRVYFRSKDGVWADSHPISRCEGRLKKVTDCVDFTTLIGTFGGCVFLVYVALRWLFFVSMSDSKTFGREGWRGSDMDDDIEVEIVSLRCDRDPR